MEVKVLSKDFMSDDPNTRRHALKLDTIKGADKLKFTMKSKPASAKPNTTKVGATAPGHPSLSAGRLSLDVIHPITITPRPPLSPSPLTEEEKRKAMNGVAEILSVFDRSLRYEVIEEAELVQLHIIDNRDGTVVRKIPTDVVVEFVKTLKEKLDSVEGEHEEPVEAERPVEIEGLAETERLDIKA
ncbi:hypothetical protein FACS1894187_02680 [Synergistales bacterium]|nr:hypothetical protein FACS1894187_02680 [Synergistales bacterium]